jgi:hypothetical protein
MDFASNGGSAATTESPRLVATSELGDPQTGRLCPLWRGSGQADDVFSMCSDDAGKSFGTPLGLTGATGVTDPHLITGAFGHGAKKSELAAVWYGIGPAPGAVANVWFALSKDGGSSFGPASAIPSYALSGMPLDADVPDVMFDDAGVIWVVYAANDNSGKGRIIVDKSCDDGVTWSGAVLANGVEVDPEAMIDTQLFPGLYQAKGKIGFLGMAPLETGDFTFEVTALLP